MPSDPARTYPVPPGTTASVVEPPSERPRRPAGSSHRHPRPRPAGPGAVREGRIGGLLDPAAILGSTPVRVRTAAVTASIRASRWVASPRRAARGLTTIRGARRSSSGRRASVDASGRGRSRSAFRRSRLDCAPPTGPPRSDGIDNSRARHARLPSRLRHRPHRVGPQARPPRSLLSFSVRASGSGPPPSPPKATRWQEGTHCEPATWAHEHHHHRPGLGRPLLRSPQSSPIVGRRAARGTGPGRRSDPGCPTGERAGRRGQRRRPAGRRPGRGPPRRSRSSASPSASWATRGGTAPAALARSTAPGSSSTPSRRPVTRRPSAGAGSPRHVPSTAGTRRAVSPVATIPRSATSSSEAAARTWASTSAVARRSAP